MVVQSIIELFHNMNLKIVAEGIETESQKKLLHEMGADFIQGFYYARPMPEDEILAFFKQ